VSLNWSAKDAPGWDKIRDGAKESLIFGTMFYGINPITESNYVEFYKRHVKDHVAQGREPYLTLEDCHNAVGLGTNASPITPAAFNKKLAGYLEALAEAYVAKERRKVAEEEHNG
jgi:hypothetical protein